MSQKSTQHEELIKAMDNIYESLIEEAQRLAAAYFEEASVDPSGTKRHVVLLIQVKRLTDQSCAFTGPKTSRPQVSQRSFGRSIRGMAPATR